MTELSQ